MLHHYKVQDSLQEFKIPDTLTHPAMKARDFNCRKKALDMR